MTPLEKFEAYMVQSNLSETAKEFWKNRFYPLDQKGQEELVVLFDDFPNDIEFFTDIQMKKEEALKNNDKKMFDQLVIQEAEFIAQAYKNN